MEPLVAEGEQFGYRPRQPDRLLASMEPLVAEGEQPGRSDEAERGRPASMEPLVAEGEQPPPGRQRPPAAPASMEPLVAEGEQKFTTEASQRRLLTPQWSPSSPRGSRPQQPSPSGPSCPGLNGAPRRRGGAVQEVAALVRPRLASMEPLVAEGEQAVIGAGSTRTTCRPQWSPSSPRGSSCADSRRQPRTCPRLNGAPRRRGGAVTPSRMRTGEAPRLNGAPRRRGGAARSAAVVARPPQEASMEPLVAEGEQCSPSRCSPVSSAKPQWSPSSPRGSSRHRQKRMGPQRRRLNGAPRRRGGAAVRRDEQDDEGPASMEPLVAEGEQARCPKGAGREPAKASMEPLVAEGEQPVEPRLSPGE